MKTASDLEKQFRKELAKQIVLAWEHNVTTKNALANVIRTIPELTWEQAYVLVAKAFKVTWFPDVLIRSYIKDHFPKLSELLWEARNTAAITIAARRACGLQAKPGTVGRLKIKVRELDRSRNWNVCK